MKFPHIIALQKHLYEVKSNLFPRIFLLIHSDRQERKRWVDKIVSILSSQVQASTLYYEEEDWRQVYNTLRTPSLFSEQEIVIWNPAKQPLEKDILTSLETCLSNIVSSHAFFLLSLEPTKDIIPLSSLAEKLGIVLDVSEEKPWDKDKRLQQELLFSVKEKNKSISSGAVERLLWGAGGDGLLLETELAKISTFVGERKEITEKDVLSIGSPSPAQTGWQQAEKLIWEGVLLPIEDVDTSFLLALLGQVRFLLQQARLVAWLLEEQKEMGEIMQKTNMKPNPLQKLIERVQKRESAFFDEALALVYQVELLLKNSSLSPSFVMDFLRIKFTYLLGSRIHA